MRFVLWLLIVAVISIAGAGLYAKWRFPDDPMNDALFRLVFGDPDLGPFDVTTSKRTGSSNDAFAAPEGLRADIQPDIVTGIVPHSVDEVFARVGALIPASGSDFRVAANETNDLGPMRRYVVRTRWIRFPDTLTVQIITRPDGNGIALYSRSQIGSYDWGMNRKRIETILGGLK